MDMWFSALEDGHVQQGKCQAVAAWCGLCVAWLMIWNLDLSRPFVSLQRASSCRAVQGMVRHAPPAQLQYTTT